MNRNNYPIIVVGASIAAISFVRTLRANNDKRKILLIHGEDRLPYKRTKINKNMVRGFDKDDFKIADREWYKDNDVDLIYDRVINIDSAEKVISTQRGLVCSYEKLMLATGAVSVIPKIAGIATENLHSVQNASDVDRVLETCKNKDRFLIIGGGVEGVETADQLVRKGKTVILANRMKYPLQKLFPISLLKELEQRMMDKGVKLFRGVSVAAIHEHNGHYTVNLQGQQLEFDEVIACTGAVPNIELGIKAGLKVERGIIVNAFMQTSDADILAAGDVAQHEQGIVTGLWHAAEHQGKLAALTLLGKPEEHTLPPFRLKTEVFGLYMFSGAYEYVIPGVDEEVEEVDGDIRRIMYYNDNALKAAVFLNDGPRAKIYQQALFEQWSKEKVEDELSLPPKMTFSFG